jgi:hypothetical protein
MSMLRKIIIALVTSAAVGLDALSARKGGWWHHLRRRRRQSLPKRNLNDGTQERRKSRIAIQFLMLASHIGDGAGGGSPRHTGQGVDEQRQFKEA